MYINMCSYPGSKFQCTCLRHCSESIKQTHLSQNTDLSLVVFWQLQKENLRPLMNWSLSWLTRKGNYGISWFLKKSFLNVRRQRKIFIAQVINLALFLLSEKKLQAYQIAFGQRQFLIWWQKYEKQRNKSTDKTLKYNLSCAVEQYDVLSAAPTEDMEEKAKQQPTRSLKTRSQFSGIGQCNFNVFLHSADFMNLYFCGRKFDCDN